MAASNNSGSNNIIGTVEDDAIVDGYQSDDGKTLQENLDAVDKVNGHAVMTRLVRVKAMILLPVIWWGMSGAMSMVNGSIIRI